MLENNHAIAVAYSVQICQKTIKSIFTVLCLGILFFWPTIIFAQQNDLVVSGWIPWWEASSGIESARQNLDVLDIIYPFVYEIENGTAITPKSDLQEAKWQQLFREADQAGVKIIPTIAWFSGTTIHQTLTNNDARMSHIEDIVALVEAGGYDGINIDYEQKLADTKLHFSLFLAQLKLALPADTLLTCALEARTPPADRFRTIPDTLVYANDYLSIGRICDRVEIMAYDQGRADWRLNEARRGAPYSAVADTEWVEKVTTLALADIPAEKIQLGIPTYGRVWDVTVAPDWYRDYRSVASLNTPRMLELADKYNVVPTRGASSELVFTYFPDTSPYRVLEALPAPAGTPSGYENAARALLFANMTGREVVVRMASYQDVESMYDKVRLAERLGLGGVAFFKIDGEEDERIWEQLRH